ncbi:hypothetical protein PUNSTDRAFT_108306 [Punctularia strigosozonata HHB-11173 SS5]|uniref:Uncharacterized protein n=1 Tax=Punctularia strigosozonata (strain HHB-11173) TaxID=741275 RepID=R7S291_PUNST|nr:uncharacterized protein PUNSTDRAFT_108306 [Punctularia strigosozonata HHB-11173 SS5]EIN04520.1 hypothetical protein PUNSTDRAFT_108306 [Punctularia strigosozonata HHB-11173 SS5]
MDYDAYDALLHHVFKRTQGDAWFKPSEENVSAGVCLRVETGHFRVFPYENPYLGPFEEAVRTLNPAVAVKIRSAAVHAALGSVPPTAPAIYVDSETRIQIVETMTHLPHADKEQCGAFVRDERVLVVWSDNLDNIIGLCQEFDRKLIQLVWKIRPALPTLSYSGSAGPASTAGSEANLNEKSAFDDAEEKREALEAQVETILKNREKAGKKKGRWPWSRSVDREDIAEKGGKEPRPQRLYAPFSGGLAVALSTLFVAQGVNMLITEHVLDGTWQRFALLVTTPFLFCISLFFCLQLLGNVAFCIGPVAQFHENSKYYSAQKPLENKVVDAALPHITIEMPVYKESLEQTIAPSVYSLKKAMQTYARQGGTSAIFVHDDGLQLISPEEREARVAFYADHNIGWVARPGHDNAPDGFKRAGRFKKASNMNYGLALSLKLEKHLAALESRAVNPDQIEGSTLEDKALNMAVEETYEETGRRWKPWAANGKSCRIGEIILIIDSDTVVPEDCFRDAARELAECPEVAIIQHESDVMQVSHDFFENGIAHFTRRINKCISFACANGEVAPFVGHNAFLRWSAVQDAAFIDTADDKEKIWSESNVSEDFDMALRLQLKGYNIRWATYSKGGFKEGVSLTVDDELNRWQKYAYGCSELIFNPLKDWWRLGPINKQLRIFVWSDAPVHYKVSMMSYMFSYYGIAIGFTLSVMNYLILGWGYEVDGFYMHSFEIWLACIVVFPGLGNFGYTLLEYRLGHRNMWDSMVENITWVPFFFFFFGGLGLHLSIALLAHMFSYNITWGATKKEVERSNFFLEVPRIFKRFWFAFAVSLTFIAGIAILASPLVPADWAIPGEDWSLIMPLVISTASHILFPIVLNPSLMVFSY